MISTDRRPRRVFIVLDADGERRGFITDGGPVSATIHGDLQPLGFGHGLQVEALPIKAASLMGEAAADAGSLTATLALDAFDLWAIRDRVPVQRVTVRAWLAPVNERGAPVDTAGVAMELLPDYEIFRGVIRSPKWDHMSRTVGFSAAPDLRLLDIRFPPAVIDSERFPDAPTDAAANAVPVVYGQVWAMPLYAVSDVTATPIRLLVAGHRVESTTLTLQRQNSTGGTDTLGAPTILYDIDALGGTYAYVEVTKLNYDAGNSLFAREFTGHVAPDGNAIDGLGDVLLHLWHTYAAERFFDLDRRRCYAARAALNRYTVGLCFNQQEAGSGLLRILQGRVEGQFPVTFGVSGGRMGWDCTRIPFQDEIPSLVVGTLTYGLDAHDRDGPSETSADAVVTSYELHSMLMGNINGTAVTTFADRDNMGVLRGASTRWGESPIRRMDAPDAALGDCAWSVLTDTAVAGSVVRDALTYGGLEGSWYDAPLYGVVLVTDEYTRTDGTLVTLYDEEPMLITAIAPGLDGRVGVSLLRIAGV